MKKYDFVIPLKASESIWGDNNELRYLLRSVEENFPVNRVIIISDHLPDWVNKKNVLFIEQGDPFLHHKDANIILKVLTAAQLPDITPTFFWSCDDHLVLREPKSYELRPFYISDLENEPSWWWSGTWKQGMRRTFNYLKKMGKHTYHYDAHIPQPIEAVEFKEIFSNFELKESERHCINTLFHNQVGYHRRYHIGILKATFEKPETEISAIRTMIHNRLYLSYNNRGLTSALQSVITEKFPNPSKYELI